MNKLLPSFGFLFDIDGVFLRGRTILKEGLKAIKLLVDDKGEWRVPVVFVTNAGNAFRKEKAKKLSDTFGVKISSEQVVLSHSPLCMFDHFHDKQVLVAGQGSIREIAENIGFKNVVTVDEFKARYPQLDVCDHKRLKPAPCAFEHYNKPIEALVLFGEPVNWETNLQLILDVLLSDGHPYRYQEDRPVNGQFNNNNNSLSLHYPHLPVLACNSDLMWMSEAPSPRLAHGSFLLALESLYEKFTGNRLLYTALVGKPSELTYHHAMGRLNLIASSLMKDFSLPVQRVYCVGDNPQTDIYGANLYNRYLKSRRGTGIVRLAQSLLAKKEDPNLLSDPLKPEMNFDPNSIPFDMHNFSALTSMVSEISASPGADGHADSFQSILVLTGVFKERISMDRGQVSSALASGETANHNHRDYPDYPELRIPSHLAKDVCEAVRYVYRKERFSPKDIASLL